MSWGFWVALALLATGLLYLYRQERLPGRRRRGIAQTVAVVAVAVLVVVVLVYGLNECTGHDGY